MRYIVSSEIGSLSRIVGFEKAIEIFAMTGFDAWDLSLFDMVKIDWSNMIVSVNQSSPFNSENYLAYAKSLRDLSDRLGIKCNQAHAPFPTSFPVINKAIYRAIECAAICGAKIIVIHPDNNLSDEENVRLLRDFVEYAKKMNIKVATENMWNWKNGHADIAACSSESSFVNTVDWMNDAAFVACLDIGHAEMMKDGTSAVHLIHALGHHRLKALHIHDNDRLHDSHQIPYSMNINFSEIAKALKDIDYDGDLTLESDTYLNPKGSQPIEAQVKNLYASICRFREEIEK